MLERLHTITKKLPKMEQSLEIFFEKNQTKEKCNKYRNIKTEYDGVIFDSIAEKTRYIVLRHREKLGKIQDLMIQQEFVLFSHELKVARYIADFTYFKDGIFIVEDVKNPELMKGDTTFNLKKKLIKAQYGIDIKCIHPNFVRIAE